MSTKVRIQLAALFLAYLGLPLAYCQDVLAPEEKIKIGVSVPLTGSAATYGIDIKNELEFANDQFGSNRYELVFEDDKCSGRDAVTVAQHFISNLGVKFVLGLPCSGAFLAAAPLYERSKVIAISSGASAAEIEHAGDFIFRTTLSDALAAKKLYAYVVAKHKRFGIFSEQTEYAQGLLKSFNQENSENKLEIVNDNFLSESNDFRTSLTKLKAKQIDGLLINSQTELTFLAVLKQVKEQNLAVPLYSAYWAGCPSLLEKANGLADGVVYVDLPSVSQVANSEGAALFKKYQLRYGRPKSIELLFATSIEAFRALDLAIKSRTDVQEFLYKTKFHGNFGDWSFDKNGEIQGFNFVLKVVKNGKGEVLDY